MIADDDRFEWDIVKAEANRRKHGVAFEAAIDVFDDGFAIGGVDVRSRGEDRLVIIGMSGGSLLTVVYTDRDETIRIISARRATRREHDHYYRQNSEA